MSAFTRQDLLAENAGTLASIDAKGESAEERDYLSLIPTKIAERIAFSGQCWIWNGELQKKTGKPVFNGRYVYRILYATLIGPIPEKHFLCPAAACTNSSCANPWHVEPIGQGVLAARQGRVYKGKPRKVYPDATVSLVRELYLSGQTQDEIAERLGITQKTVWKIMSRNGIAARVAAKRDQRGSKNHKWKEGAANYKTLHGRVESLRGRPGKCEVCGSTDPDRIYNWASLTRRYEDPWDYKRMCLTCHRQYDKKYREENNIPTKWDRVAAK